MRKLYIFLFLIIICKSDYSSGDESDGNNEFDILIFTQQWPATFCYEWMNSDSKHTCQLPSPTEIWSIHGVWPTKFGKMGPFNCNSTWEFDINKISNIRPTLEQFWLNIEKGTPVDHLWKHEWDKHGTCATTIIELNNEEKYFGQGLIWLQQYTMSSILKDAYILPGSEYTVNEIHDAVLSKLKVEPVIHCYYDKHDQKNYLAEIRLCFNKKLEMQDCNGVVNGERNIISNCDTSKSVYYPTNVPLTRFKTIKESEWKFPFVNFYKLIQLIQWITL